MEWRQQSSVSCEDAFNEAQRWIEEVTGKTFGCSDFRAALENGVLLCDLINQLKPGIVKRVNRLSTPIAGLDNVSVFLKACGKLGLNDSQLFHPGDLQDLSTRVTLRHDETKRRLKNVLITIFWLGRKAHLDSFYNGPQLNFKAFEGLLGLALSKSLEDNGNALVKDGGNKESQYSPAEDSPHTTQSYLSGNSVERIGFLHTYVPQSEEGCGSDAESEQVYRMENRQPSAHRNKGYTPKPLREKQALEETARKSSSPLSRSKSLSDIPMVYPVRKVKTGSHYNNDKDFSSSTQWNQENRRRCSVAAKDNEAQWQDDLNKWKNRRRSGKSELQRFSLDREHVINQMITGAGADFGADEVQGGAAKRDFLGWKHSSAPSTCFISSPSSDPMPHKRGMPTHQASEVFFSPTDSACESSVDAVLTSDGTTLGENSYIASLALNKADVITPVECSFATSMQTVGSRAESRVFAEHPKKTLQRQFSSFVETIQPKEIVISTKSPNSAPPSSVNGMSVPSTVTRINLSTSHLGNGGNVAALGDQSQDYSKSKKSLKLCNEATGGATVQQAANPFKFMSRSVSWANTASFPRGYRRSESHSLLSSAVTPRPFGTKQPRISSLPRVPSVDDRLGPLTNTKTGDFQCSSAKSCLKRQTAAAHLRGQYQASVRQKKADQAISKEIEKGGQASCAPFSKQPSSYNSGRILQSQATSKTLPQPDTSQNSCGSGDWKGSSQMTSFSPKVDHSDMRVTLTLKPKSVPDFGFQTVWNNQKVRISFVQRGSPAELCRLLVYDEIIAVDGVAVKQINPTQWKNKMASSLQGGTLTLDIRRYGIKDWSSCEDGSLNQPGQSRLTLNLTATAPVLMGCANNSSTTVMAVPKSNEPTSNGCSFIDNQEEVKYVERNCFEDPTASENKENCIGRKNHKIREEFFKLGGGSDSAISDLQVPSLRPSSSWSWDSEEDRRRLEKWQEEQERLLQEKYQRDQERLEAEWQRAQQDAVEAKKSEPVLDSASRCETFTNSQPHVNGLKENGSEDTPSPDEEHKEPRRQSNEQHGQSEKTADWAEGTCGFARLSSAYRAKSMSTPALAGLYGHKGEDGRRKGRSLSKAEKERQQILQEMKKRTQLLTDNSWIRQQSIALHKEPVSSGFTMKRYESLDNLDALRQSSSPTVSYPLCSSATETEWAPDRTAASCYSKESSVPGRHAHDESHQPSRRVSAWRICCVCKRALGSEATMVIDDLSLYFHFTCFQCVGCHRHLSGTRTRVQVRIRNRKPFCERCYFQLKSPGALPM